MPTRTHQRGGTPGSDVRQGTQTGRDRGSYCTNTASSCTRTTSLGHSTQSILYIIYITITIINGINAITFRVRVKGVTRDDISRRQTLRHDA